MTYKSKNKINEKQNPLKYSHNLENYEIKSEIDSLINSSDFIDYVKSNSETFDDGVTYNEFLSSKAVLQKASIILKKLAKENLDQD